MMIRNKNSRRKFLSVASLSVLGGIAGCISSNSQGSESNNEPVLGEVIEEYADVVTVDTYENTSGSWLHRGVASLPLLISHTAQVEYSVDPTIQEGYDVVPLNCYFTDVENFLSWRNESGFEAIGTGSMEQIDDEKSFSLRVDPGLYYLILGSAEVGRRSKFDFEYEARELLNYNSNCDISTIEVNHLSMEQTSPIFSTEFWNIRFHIQYDGEEGSVYNLELSLVSSADEITVEVQQRQIENCETNFVYDDERGLNVINAGEKIIAQIKIFDEQKEEILVEQTQEVKDVIL